jgi:hypothetical protein
MRLRASVRRSDDNHRGFQTCNGQAFAVCAEILATANSAKIPVEPPRCFVVVGMQQQPMVPQACFGFALRCCNLK